MPSVSCIRGKTHEVWFDTLLGHHIPYPRVPHNFGCITAQYTDHLNYTDEDETWILTSSDITMLWTAVSLGPAMIRLDVSYEAKRNLYTAAVRHAPSPGGFHRRRRKDT